MAELSTVARPYAEALAQVARETGTWDAWSETLGLLAAVCADAQVDALIRNPSVPDARVVELVQGVMAGKSVSGADNLVQILAENDRLTLLPQIAVQFETARAAAAGTLEARITSAYPLEEAQVAALCARLEARYQRKVAASHDVDASLIGGVVIQIGDEVMDASVRGKLADMRVALKD
jgi:F-type H+-transporting ATPase subunit delta